MSELHLGNMQLWFSSSALARLIHEADAKWPLETGGLLAGYLSAGQTDVVVTDIVTSGPNAVHSRSSYRPDYLSDRERIGHIHDRTTGTTTYMGDWHSHPSGDGRLSWRDRRALRNIARFRDNYLDQPAMLIIGQPGPGSRWKPEAWRILRSQGGALFGRWLYVPMQVTVY